MSPSPELTIALTKHANGSTSFCLTRAGGTGGRLAAAFTRVPARA